MLNNTGKNALTTTITVPTITIRSAISAFLDLAELMIIEKSKRKIPKLAIILSTAG
jgi:hypothetical protein